MPNTANRKRPLQVRFFVGEDEFVLIKQRMGELCMSVYPFLLV